MPPGGVAMPSAGAPGAAPAGATTAASVTANPPSVGSLFAPSGPLGQIRQGQAETEAKANQTVAQAKTDQDQYNEARVAEISAQRAGYPLAQLHSLYEKYGGNLPSGHGAGDYISAASAADFLSSILGHFRLNSDDSNLTGLQLLRKYGTQVSQAVASNFKINPTNMALESAEQTSPGAELNPEANQHLIDNLWRINQLAVKFNHDKQAYYESHGQSLNGWNDAWRGEISDNNAIPLSKYPSQTSNLRGVPMGLVPSTDPAKGQSWFPMAELQ